MFNKTSTFRGHHAPSDLIFCTNKGVSISCEAFYFHLLFNEDDQPYISRMYWAMWYIKEEKALDGGS